MKTNIIARPNGFYCLSYPVGDRPDQLRKFCLAMAPEIDALATKHGPICLACRGSSGAMIASCLSMFMENEVVIYHIKKDGEKAHGVDPHYSLAERSVVVVDDFVSEGHTLRAICHVLIDKQHKGLLACVLNQRRTGKAKSLVKELGFANYINLEQI